MPGDAEQIKLELAELLHAQNVLEQHGVASGPHGFDLSTMAKAIYEHGWSYSIDRLGPSHRAVIRAVRTPTQQQADARQADRSRYGLLTGYGDTAAEALALALASALQRSADDQR